MAQIDASSNASYFKTILKQKLAILKLAILKLAIMVWNRLKMWTLLSAVKTCIIYHENHSFFQARNPWNLF